MPDIWLLQSLEDEVANPAPAADDLRSVPGPIVGQAAWAYVPPWSLRPGFNIEAEAQKFIRRFIQSSLIDELLFKSDPIYKREVLFPIVESGTWPLPNDTVATATIHPTLRPGYAYLRDSKAYKDLSKFEKGSCERNILCTFIDDYREGSILDVLGSVGGLYALLQSIHLLLFGRPMLWGLTGAKAIAPFGLLGMCSFRNFKHRLREHYHRQPTKDNPGTFLMGAFLRDFVVDLGPANVNPDVKPISSTNRTFPTLSADQRDETINSQWNGIHIRLKSGTRTRKYTGPSVPEGFKKLRIKLEFRGLIYLPNLALRPLDHIALSDAVEMVWNGMPLAGAGVSNGQGRPLDP
ncbi:hypothetical protein OPQ81_011411 [Rhizoctonia solani]|nr:hypothetical protein OPQ81_011411 [Rhizoctonia solani]